MNRKDQKIYLHSSNDFQSADNIPEDNVFII